jgi:ATP-dependent Lon protease
MNKVEEKEKLNKALKEIKIAEDRHKVKEIFKSHIGFGKEKQKFLESSQLYIQFRGNLRPRREVICYSGPPGVGKTTFVKTLKNAMGRPLELVPCAGLANPAEYSILGDKDKPSLVAWAIMKNGYKNPIILLDELEKVTDEKIQADLIKLFEAFKEEGVYEDPYFQQEIDLKYLDFFAAVNYDEKLATKLKDNVNLIRLLGYTEKEKMQILQRKITDMQKIYNLEKEEIEKTLSDDVLKFLINT